MVDGKQQRALEELRERLRQGLARRGWTTEQLARRAGRGRTTVWKALSDNQPAPSRATVAALARALALNESQLLELLRQAATSAPPPSDPPPPPSDAPATSEGAADQPHNSPTGARTFWSSLAPGRRRRRPVAIATGAVGLAVAVVAALDPLGWRDPGLPQESGLGDPRKADPCSLLDARTLDRFGDTRLDTNYGDFDRCDILVRDHDGDEVADVSVTFASDPVEPNSGAESEKVGSVTVTEVPSDSHTCVRNLRLADGQQIWLAAKRLDSPAPDLCSLARAATDHAVKVLNKGPVPHRRQHFPADSLARLHACTLLPSSAFDVARGIDGHKPDRDLADWGCEWTSRAGDAEIELLFSQDDDLSDNGQPTRLGGMRSYVAPGDMGEGTCTVRTEFRAYTDLSAEHTVELIMLTAQGPRPEKELCATAKALTAEVAAQLPKVTKP